jgi:hypothetical protein
VRGDRFGLRAIRIRTVGCVVRWRRRTSVTFALMFELTHGAIAVRAPNLGAFEMRSPRNGGVDQTFVFDAVQRDGENCHVSSVI